MDEKHIVNLRSGIVFGFRDLLWVSAGFMPHLGCSVPVQVRTNEQTYRETQHRLTYRETAERPVHFWCPVPV